MANKEPGYVYILTNPSFREDWVKIGKSSRPVDVRSKELDNTAVPLPFEQGMQSLWIFMRKRKLHEAIRTSLENFGQFDHYDPEDELEQRHVDIIPLYALSNLN